jgi:hypothetical protein
VSRTRRITVDLPAALLAVAQEITGKGITDTMIEGLEQLKRRRFYQRALALRGKLRLDVNVDEVRGRHR